MRKPRSGMWDVGRKNNSREMRRFKKNTKREEEEIHIGTGKCEEMLTSITRGGDAFVRAKITSVTYCLIYLNYTLELMDKKTQRR